MLFPTALYITQAISLSSERLSNSTLANSSLKLGILRGEALFLGILNSPKSGSSSWSKISLSSGYYILLLLLLLLLLLSDLT